VAAINRTGHEGAIPGGIDFWGGSFLCDPEGDVVARCSHDKEETVVLSCDLGKVDTIRTHWPFLRDRRVDAYQDLTRRYLD
jgi:N-carbamoylputrescine amidase